MFDTIFYEVEYLVVNKESLAANNIAENLFSQVDEEVSIFMLYDEKVYHCIDGTDAMLQDALIITKM